MSEADYRVTASARIERGDYVVVDGADPLSVRPATRDELRATNLVAITSARKGREVIVMDERTWVAQRARQGRVDVLTLGRAEMERAARRMEAVGREHRTVTATMAAQADAARAERKRIGDLTIAEALRAGRPVPVATPQDIDGDPCARWAADWELVRVGMPDVWKRITSQEAA